MKASQWSTLWMEDVRLILDHEEENKPLWENIAGAQDEWYPINVLSNHGASNFVMAPATTYVSWWVESPVDVSPTGNPYIVSCNQSKVTMTHERKPPPVRPMKYDRKLYDDFDSVLQVARHSGAYFARKFDPSCVSLLVQDILHSDKATRNTMQGKMRRGLPPKDGPTSGQQPPLASGKGHGPATRKQQPPPAGKGQQQQKGGMRGPVPQPQQDDERKPPAGQGGKTPPPERPGHSKPKVPIPDGGAVKAHHAGGSGRGPR